MSKYQIYKLKDLGEQCWYWRLLNSDDKNIANSYEPMLKGDIISSIKRIRQEAPEAPIKEIETTKHQDNGSQFEFHKSAEDGQWDWFMTDGNHKIVAVGKIFASQDSVLNTLEGIQKDMGDAEITWEDPEDDPDYQAKLEDLTETVGIPGS